MTKQQEELVRALRQKLLLSSYPPIFVVSREELEAVEDYLISWLESIGEPTILKCGKHGLYFKGCELVLEVKEP